MRKAALFVLLLPPLAAQTDRDPYQRMAESKAQVSVYLAKVARAITDRAEDEIRDVATWEKVKGRRLEEMRDMLGLLPWPERTPLNVRITGTLDKGPYTIEKIAFESLPKIYVTANLYVPKVRRGRVPAVIYVCGHAGSPYGAKTQYQRHGISFAKNGYVCMILDPIQIAETFALHHGVRSQEMYDWYSRGYTPAGVEVWNAMRAIDYLGTRPEVDMERIGMTGRSGGAAMSWFAAAVDPRIKVVAPVMGISTYAANIPANTQRLHCDCMFAINSYAHDMIHQGALIAPRPLLMAHGRKDNLFPVAGYEEFERKVGALYLAYSRPEDFRNIVVDTAHQDSDYLREQVIRWFDRFLMKIPERKLDIDYTNAPDESLAVFGGKPPADALNYRVHEIFTARAPARRTELQDLLRTKVFGAMLSEPSDFPVRRTVLWRPAKPSGAAPGLLYIASDGEDDLAIHDLLGPARSRRASVGMVVWPRGVGAVPWDKTFWKDTLRNAMHIGQTVDSMRLADVLKAVGALRAENGVDARRIMVTGKGISGALALYAAILDERIEQVTLIDPPVSHVQGPIFLNILRYTDLPGAAALVAPRRINFYARRPEAYGKLESTFVTMDLAAVLEGRYDHNFSSGQ